MKKRLAAAFLLGSLAEAATEASRSSRAVTTTHQSYCGNLYGHTKPYCNTVTRETVATTRQIMEACCYKYHSIGREFAYLIHKNEKSGWHNGYNCSYDTAREYAAIARSLGVDNIYPHDSDRDYERLGRIILNYVNEANVI